MQQINTTIRVLCPPSHVLKLNVDDLFLHFVNIRGGAGLLRDDKGESIDGFAYRKRFMASPLQVELMIIKDDIEFLQGLEVAVVVMHCDYLLVVQALL